MAEIIMKCEDCGYEPKPDKDKSNENWDCYDTTCPKCSGDIIPELGD